MKCYCCEKEGALSPEEHGLSDAPLCEKCLDMAVRYFEEVDDEMCGIYRCRECNMEMFNDYEGGYTCPDCCEERARQKWYGTRQ